MPPKFRFASSNYPPRASKKSRPIFFAGFHWRRAGRLLLARSGRVYVPYHHHHPFCESQRARAIRAPPPATPPLAHRPRPPAPAPMPRRVRRLHKTAVPRAFAGRADNRTLQHSSRSLALLASRRRFHATLQHHTTHAPRTHSVHENTHSPQPSLSAPPRRRADVRALLFDLQHSPHAAYIQWRRCRMRN